MKKTILFLLPLILLTACGERSTDTETGTNGASQPEARQSSAKPAKSKKQGSVLPPGMSVPFAHRVRANRSEPLGGAVRKRVVVEIKGPTLEQADTQIGEVAAGNGYERGQKSSREGGFVVTYQHPDAGTVRTSFFTGDKSKYSSPDVTGIMQVVWIARR